MNFNRQGTGDKMAAQSNEHRILSVFEDASFTKKDAADVLGISASGAYKLLKRMTVKRLLFAHKKGKQWVYRRATSSENTIKTTK